MTKWLRLLKSLCAISIPFWNIVFGLYSSQKVLSKFCKVCAPKHCKIGSNLKFILLTIDLMMIQSLPNLGDLH